MLFKLPVQIKSSRYFVIVADPGRLTFDHNASVSSLRPHICETGEVSTSTDSLTNVSQLQ